MLHTYHESRQHRLKTGERVIGALVEEVLERGERVLLSLPVSAVLSECSGELRDSAA
jgi:hypothetical protein